MPDLIVHPDYHHWKYEAPFVLNPFVPLTLFFGGKSIVAELRINDNFTYYSSERTKWDNLLYSGPFKDAFISQDEAKTLLEYFIPSFTLPVYQEFCSYLHWVYTKIHSYYYKTSAPFSLLEMVKEGAVHVFLANCILNILPENAALSFFEIQNIIDYPEIDITPALKLLIDARWVRSFTLLGSPTSTYYTWARG